MVIEKREGENLPSGEPNEDINEKDWPHMVQECINKPHYFVSVDDLPALINKRKTIINKANNQRAIKAYESFLLLKNMHAFISDNQKGVFITYRANEEIHQVCIKLDNLIKVSKNEIIRGVIKAMQHFDFTIDEIPITRKGLMYNAFNIYLMTDGIISLHNDLGRYLHLTDDKTKYN